MTRILITGVRGKVEDVLVSEEQLSFWIDVALEHNDQVTEDSQ